MTYSRSNMIEELQKLSKGKEISRDTFRDETKIPERAWRNEFGTWKEFKTAAGILDRPAVTQISNQIAKHSSLDLLRAMTNEKRSFSGKYLKPSGNRFQTVLVGSDIHDIECDPFWRMMFLDAAKRVQPERIILNGDLFDLPEFSKYSVDPREWDVVGRIKWVHSFLEDLRKAAPNSEINLIEGNHECVADNTEILTTDGWVLAKDITLSTFVAQVDLNTNEIQYSTPIALKSFEDNLLKLSGDLHDELVSSKHKVVINNKRVAASSKVGEVISQTEFMYSAFNNFDDNPLYSDDDIRLLTWVIADATIVRRQITNTRIQWKLSRTDKIEKLSELLNKMGIKFTLRKANWSITNKVQPYYICIYGDEARRIYQLLDGVKTYPKGFKTLSKSQVEILIQSLIETDGHSHYNQTLVTTSKKEEADFLQLLFISNGIPCKISSATNRGFTNNLIYKLAIFNNGLSDRRKVTVEDIETKGVVVAIQTQKETLITRRNGKVVVTGNCRLLKHLCEATPAMKSILSDLHGFTVPKLLGIDKYEVNYIAPADLATLTKADERAEIRRNFLIMYDCLVAHHFPEGKSFGMPGFNGHHHSHIVDTLYNPTFGAYEWHQLGSGHKREAPYCNGEKWSNGFALVHVDTLAKKTQFEYIDTTNDHVVFGGEWYTRADK